MNLLTNHLGTDERTRLDAEAILRVARELRSWLTNIDDSESRSLLEDVDRMERVGRWLASTKVINLSGDPK